MSTPATPAGQTIPEAVSLAHIEKFSWGGNPGDLFVILGVMCPHENCRKLLHMGIMPVGRLQQMAEGESPIHMPS